ncbi:MAG: small basic protein [Planctomycetota bacterium]
MSIHPSLRGINTLVGERSVFTRRERLERLMRDGKMTADASAYGLPKVRTIFKLKSKRVVKKEEKETKKGGKKGK